MKPIKSLALALLAATASGRPLERALFGGGSDDGDACIKAAAQQALAGGTGSNIDLQRAEQASLAKVKDSVGGGLVDVSASFSAAKRQLLESSNAEIAGNANDLALIDRLVKDFLGGIQQNEHKAIDYSVFCDVDENKDRSAPSPAPSARGKPSPPPGSAERARQRALSLRKRQAYGSEYVTEPMPTTWIFGAMMICLGVVIAGILLLRRRRKENMARAEADEMRWEDAMA